VTGEEWVHWWRIGRLRSFGNVCMAPAQKAGCVCVLPKGHGGWHEAWTGTSNPHLVCPPWGLEDVEVEEGL
jgi:hypothetical protein